MIVRFSSKKLSERRCLIKGLLMGTYVPTDKIRQQWIFQIMNHIVCKRYFIVSSASSIKQLNRVQACILKNTLAPGTGCFSNLIGKERELRVITFIKNFASINGHVCPDRRKINDSAEPLLWIPIMYSRRSIYETYYKPTTTTPVSERTFFCFF